ncbi:hypothetical protein DFH09DRAFT_1078015 [Mycena vulgaris]|nr:hypothetical protein DFH09DRAFT_1078015 [Mycena vulgaris]
MAKRRVRCGGAVRCAGVWRMEGCGERSGCMWGEGLEEKERHGTRAGKEGRGEDEDDAVICVVLVGGGGGNPIAYDELIKNLARRDPGPAPGDLSGGGRRAYVEVENGMWVRHSGGTTRRPNWGSCDAHARCTYVGNPMG